MCLSVIICGSQLLTEFWYFSKLDCGKIFSAWQVKTAYGKVQSVIISKYKSVSIWIIHFNSTGNNSRSENNPNSFFRCLDVSVFELVTPNLLLGCGHFRVDNRNFESRVQN